MSVILRTRAVRDRYAALLRDSLHVLSTDTVDKWLEQLESDLHDPNTETEGRLECNAMLVGVLSVMLESIDASQGEPRV